MAEYIVYTLIYIVPPRFLPLLVHQSLLIHYSYNNPNPLYITSPRNIASPLNPSPPVPPPPPTVQLLPHLSAQIQRRPIRRLIPPQIPHRPLVIELIQPQNINPWSPATLHSPMHGALDLGDLFRVSGGGVPVLDVEAGEIVVVREGGLEEALDPFGFGGGGGEEVEAVVVVGRGRGGGRRRFCFLIRVVLRGAGLELLFWWLAGRGVGCSAALWSRWQAQDTTNRR